MEKKEKKKKPESSHSHLEAGKFYFLNDRFDEAIKELSLAIREDSRNAEAYYNLGLVYKMKNMPVEAKDSFNKALEINPDHKSSEEHLAKLVGV